MLNHARNLLMNINGGGYFPDYPGDEIIPSEYAELRLPNYLKVIRTRLFGAMPDRTMLNYRCAQLLRLIESTELQEFVLDLDKRITYHSHPTSLALTETFTPTVEEIVNTTNSQFTIIGQPISPDASGITRYDFTILQESKDITVTRTSPPTNEYAEQGVFTNSQTQPYDLTFTGYKFRITTTANGNKWRVRGFLRPTDSLSSIEESLRSVGEPNLIQLFGVEKVEPYRTFQNCWNDHPEFAYRLGGLVMALIYRTNDDNLGAVE